jgi:Ca2+-binding RTX toxin-like protein
MESGRTLVPPIRLVLVIAAAVAAVAMLPAVASADECSINKVSSLDPGNALFDSQGFEFDVNSASTAGPDRNDPFATLDNGGDSGPAGIPPGPRNSADAWDHWGSLFVGGDALGNLYFSTNDNSCTREDGGRELVFPQTTINGLLVQRKLFVAANGLPGGRILNLVTNPGTAPVTTSVQVGDVQSDDDLSDLGSDSLTAVRSSSSGDALLTTADLWGVTSDHSGGATNTDPALAHVIDGNGGRERIGFVTLTGTAPGTGDVPDNLAWRWDNVAILPGQTAAFVSFEVQQAVAGADAATEDANAATQANALEVAGPAVVFNGMSEHEVGSTRNWKVTQSCLGQQPTIGGTDGPDTLVGTNGPDVILCYEGNDTVNGIGGKDLICGSEGNDKLIGGKGNDKLFGSNGKDRLFGNRGNDRLTGANGKDKLFGGRGKDQLIGGPGKDACHGGPGKNSEHSC